MAKEHKAHLTSPLIPLNTACTDCLETIGATNEELHRDGAISKDGTFAWLHTGAYLETLNTQDGSRISAWCFGAITKDPSTVITCCCELKSPNGASSLIVGTKSMTTHLLVMFDIKSTRVIKAVQFPQEVSSIEVVCNVGADLSQEHSISPQLQYFSGIVAVGTKGSHIYLLDLNMDIEDKESDEIRPAQLYFLNPHIRQIASERAKALAENLHLCLELGVDVHRRGNFHYKKPDDQTMKHFTSDSVWVSKMEYLQHTGQLAVGFSFGCFQLWRIAVPVLEYSSRYEEELAAVTHFAFQEPENDPRNYCYMWVTRGPQPHQHEFDFNSVISLYQMGFNKKVWYDGFGYHFEELNSVGPRFEHELTTDPYNLRETVYGSRIVACRTLCDPNFRFPEGRPDFAHDSFEEGSGGQDLSLCVMVWEAGLGEPSCHLAVFDINRWYHAQMPYTVRPFSTQHEPCSFFGFYTLKDIVNACSPAGLLSVHVPFSSLSKFHSVSIPAPEQHFYPASMAFDACFLVENGLVQSKYLGVQREFLAELQRLGVEAVADPTAMYNACLQAALMPRTIDSTSLQVHKREAILSTALDYGLMAFLNNCITRFSSGELIARGCSLRVLADWAWKRVGQVKECVDKICVPLYDWSGGLLDGNSLHLLHQQHTCLDRLTAVLGSLLCQPATDIGKEDLETRLRVCTLIKQHVEMVLWFYSVGLLPEHPEEEGDGLTRYSYPAKVLTETYSTRRRQITSLHATLRSADVLHIDGLVARAGSKLSDLLVRGGDQATGQYPFPSFHCLLAMLLLEEVTVELKQTLVFYTLCDLYALVPEHLQQEFNDKMQQFTQAFAIPTSVQKFVQAIWLLDHKDFQDALTYLLDPTLDGSLAPWQHTLTIKALLYQAQYRLALKYMRIKRPPLFTPEDVKLRLTVLLANGLTSEAFEYQRLCRDQQTADDLLSHLFVGSQQMKSADALLQLPLSRGEEAHLVQQLTSSTQLQAQELLVMYYLQRARFTEAIALNARIKQTFMNDMDTTSKERTLTRNSIVEGYQRLLPRVQRQMALSALQDGGIIAGNKARSSVRRQYVRPRPLSLSVTRRERDAPVTRASLLRHVLDSARQVHQAEQRLQNPHGVEEQDVDLLRVESHPFICQPLASRAAATGAPQSSLNMPEQLVFPTSCKLQLRDTSIFGAGPATPISGAVPRTRLFPMRTAETAQVSTSMTSAVSQQPAGVSVPALLSDTLRAKRRMTTAADISLLQTPPVKRRSPRRPRVRGTSPEASSEPTVGTPQSILKVRSTLTSIASGATQRLSQQSSRRSPSPQLFAHSTRLQTTDLALPTPPRLTRKISSQLGSTSTSVQQTATTPSLPSVPSLGAKQSSTSSTGTPKHLRFSMPLGKEDEEESEVSEDENEGAEEKEVAKKGGEERVDKAMLTDEEDEEESEVSEDENEGAEEKEVAKKGGEERVDKAMLTDEEDEEESEVSEDENEGAEEKEVAKKGGEERVDKAMLTDEEDEEQSEVSENENEGAEEKEVAKKGGDERVDKAMLTDEEDEEEDEEKSEDHVDKANTVKQNEDGALLTDDDEDVEIEKVEAEKEEKWRKAEQKSKDQTEESEESDIDVEEYNDAMQRERTPSPPAKGWRRTPERDSSSPPLSVQESPQRSGSKELPTGQAMTPSGAGDSSGSLLGDSPLARTGIRDRSPKQRGSADNSLTEDFASAPSSPLQVQDKEDVQDAVRVDTDITFNYTANLAQKVATDNAEDDGDTEPLEGVKSADQEGLNDHDANEMDVDIVSIRSSDPKHPLFGSRVRMEVGVTRIDETVVIMKTTPPKQGATQSERSLKDDSAQDGNDDSEVEIDSDNEIDIEGDKGLKLQLETEESPKANMTTNGKELESAACSTNNKNLNNYVKDARFNLLDVSVVVSPATQKRAQSAYASGSVSATLVTSSIVSAHQSTSVSSTLTNVTSISHSDLEQTPVIATEGDDVNSDTTKSQRSTSQSQGIWDEQRPASPESKSKQRESEIEEELSVRELRSRKISVREEEESSTEQTTKDTQKRSSPQKKNEVNKADTGMEEEEEEDLEPVRQLRSRKVSIREEEETPEDQAPKHVLSPVKETTDKSSEEIDENQDQAPVHELRSRKISTHEEEHSAKDQESAVDIEQEQPPVRELRSRKISVMEEEQPEQPESPDGEAQYEQPVRELRSRKISVMEEEGSTKQPESPEGEAQDEPPVRELRSRNISVREDTDVSEEHTKRATRRSTTPVKESESEARETETAGSRTPSWRTRGSKAATAPAKEITPDRSRSRTPVKEARDEDGEEEEEGIRTPSRRTRAAAAKTDVEDTQKSPARTPMRASTRKANKKTEAVTTPPRRSGRLQDTEEAQEFKTPPHPTRLVMPPTPPESHTPSPSQHKPTKSHSLPPSRIPVTTTAGIAAPKRGRTRARSRSTSPAPEVTKADDKKSEEPETGGEEEEDVHQTRGDKHSRDRKNTEVEEEEKDEDEDAKATRRSTRRQSISKEKQEAKEKKTVRRSREVELLAPVEEVEPVRTLRSGRRVSMSRDVKPESRDATYVVSRDVSRDPSPMSSGSREGTVETRDENEEEEELEEEFSFSAPHTIHDFDGEPGLMADTAMESAHEFVFSPPLTRAIFRRLSVTPAPSPASTLTRTQSRRLSVTPAPSPNTSVTRRQSRRLSVTPAPIESEIVTRAQVRRMSLTPAAPLLTEDAPSESRKKRTSVSSTTNDDVMTEVPVESTKDAGSPPKKAKGLPKKKSTKSTSKSVVDSPINFLPEVAFDEEGAGSRPTTRRVMTLRARNRPAPLQRTRVFSLKK